MHHDDIDDDCRCIAGLVTYRHGEEDTETEPCHCPRGRAVAAAWSAEGRANVAALRAEMAVAS